MFGAGAADPSQAQDDTTSYGTRDFRAAVLSYGQRSGLVARSSRADAGYGPKSGPNAGSRASSPGERAAACDCQKIRELGFRLPDFQRQLVP